MTRAGIGAMLSIVVLVGCGGQSSADDSGPATSGLPPAPTPSLSRVSYVRRANELCQSAARHVPQFPGTRRGSGYTTTANQVIPYLKQLLVVNLATIDSFNALRPPRILLAPHEQLIGAQQQRVVDLTAALRAAVAGDRARFTDAFQKDQKTDEPRYARAAAALGLRACIASR